MTNPDFHQRASRLFLELCEAAPHERAALLTRTGEEDPELVRHVQALLDRDNEPSSFLDTPIVGEDFRIPTLGGAVLIDAPLPTAIGRYRIHGLLGRGGMGSVYLAEQDSPRRQVALKVIDAGLASPDALRRFAFEAEVLARLHHPGIAQIYEAGAATADGRTRVFFAMELVTGRPLTAYAAAAALEHHDRLALLATVCDAVQHAHTKGVVHRDLKPANVLVDESGRPHVLDFGIARAVGDPSDQTMHTLAGQVVGTLPYMAPEQVRGKAGEVDTRADVYALGVMLYELLASHPPLEVARCPLAEAARIIAEQEPMRLGQVDRRFRGDIETIAAKALAKDPALRYQTAADLGADIRRFLARQPIAARPPSAVYDVRKYLARNRWAGPGATLVVALLVLLIFVVFELQAHWNDQVLAAQASEASAAKQTALETQARDTSEAQQKLFTDLITALVNRNSAPGSARAPLTAADVVQEASNLLATRRIQKDAMAESGLHRAIGQLAMFTVGLSRVAEVNYQRALELWDEASPEMDGHRANLVNMVALANLDAGHFPEAEQRFTELAAFMRATDRASTGNMVVLLDSLASAQSAQGHHAAAAESLAEAVAVENRLTQAPGIEAIGRMTRLADAYRLAGRLDDADQTLQEALNLCEPPNDNTPAMSMLTLRSLARLEATRGDHDKALAIRTRVLAVARELHPANDHKDVATALLELAESQDALGDAKQAESTCLEALEVVRKSRGPFPKSEARVLDQLATLVGRDPNRQTKAAEYQTLAAQARERAGLPPDPAVLPKP